MTNKLRMSIKAFLDSKTWRFIRAMLELSLFIFLFAQSIGRIPSVKGYIGVGLWSLGILMASTNLISLLLGRKIED